MVEGIDLVYSLEEEYSLALTGGFWFRNHDCVIVYFHVSFEVFVLVGEQECLWEEVEVVGVHFGHFVEVFAEVVLLSQTKI